MRISALQVLAIAALAPFWALAPLPPAGAGLSPLHLLQPALPTESPSAGGEAGDVRLLSSDPDGVAIRVQVPWQRLRIEPEVLEGGEAVQVSIPGWGATSQPGAPELPMLAQSIGVPFGAVLSLQVEPGPARTLPLPAPVAPAAAWQVEWLAPSNLAAPAALPRPAARREEDPAIYAGGSPYPGVLAKITADGVLRQQRLAGIAIYPVQYDAAAARLTVYEWLRVEVRFRAMPADGGDRSPNGSAPSRPESPAYEQVLRRTLLNYDTARAWRRFTAGPSASGTGAEAEGVPWAPPVPGWRVRARQEGMVRLTYSDLLSAGLPVDSLDPRTFQLFHLGGEAAIEVRGEADGQFDAEDGLVFFAQALTSKYTRDNVYWLTYGQAAGLRMAARDATPGGGEQPAFHVARRPLEQNLFYVPNAPGDDDLDRWFWDWLYPPSRPSWNHTFTLAAPYTGTFTATLSVGMLGYRSDPISPDHHVQVLLNGVQVDDLWWDGITWKVSQAEIPQALLLPGANTLSLVHPGDTGTTVDVIEIDRAELTFADSFLASGDEAAFVHEVTGTWQYRVEGFTGAALAAYDVSDPSAVVRLEGIEVVASGGGYAAVFQDIVAAPARYQVLDEPAYRAAEAIESETPSDLRSPDNGADEILVSHAAFWASAADLAAYRTSQGLRVALVDLRDVYDEFGYGIEEAGAIREFLAYAYGQWQAPAPSYVLLIGDGHYDPKDYYGYGRTSYVPPYLAAVDPWITETAGDNRYVTVVGDDTLPDLMLGRMSVNSDAEAAALVGKVVAYEQSPEPGDWNSQVLAVADNRDAGGNFPQRSDDLLACCLPEPYAATKVYYGITHTTPAQARAAIQAGINAGALLVNYVGHGAQDMWASEGLFTAGDVPLLQNGGRLPVMLPMTCYDGYYHYPFPADWGMDALGEVVTRAAGRGAVASWSPAGLGVATGHGWLDQGFFRAVFEDGVRSIGQATLAGKLALWATGSHLELIDTYLLFGDPAVRLYALDADLEVEKTAQPSGPLLAGDVLTYTLTFANAGPALAHHVVLTDVIPLELEAPTVVYQSPEVSGTLPGVSFAWQIRDLLPGEAGEIIVRATVPAGSPPGEILNAAQIAGAEPEIEPEDNTAEAATVVAEPMRVGPINIASRLLSGGRYAIVAKSRVLDLGQVPIAGASVQARWTLPDATEIDQQTTSDPLGRFKFRLKSALPGTYGLCITDVTKPGGLYLPQHNAETCDWITVQ